ncbi:MAG: RcnB family protein [Hyphomonadaceae bacterium]
MKRLTTAALAALVIAGPLSAGAASAQQFRGNDRGDRQVTTTRTVTTQRTATRGDERRDIRREDRRDNRRWDQSRYNGYYMNGRFFYGEPSARIMARRDYRPAWQQWRRGDRLPAYARTHYRQVDWRRERLRAPPRGYHYVRDDRGEVLLVGIATGVILSILLSN